MGLRVLIVEDMATYRTIISRCLEEIEDVEVVGKVSNGKKALEFLQTNEVDLITLDVEMPVMDGLATLRELRAQRNRADVVMLSGLSDQAASLTIKCLELGAVDFVLKPQTSSFLTNQKQLVEHLREILTGLKRRSAFARLSQRRTVATGLSPASVSPTPPVTAPPPPSLSQPSPRPTFTAPSYQPPPPSSPSASPTLTVGPRKSRLIQPRPKILVIGVSTGGPKALSEVWESLRGPLPYPILIVQHMPPKFTKSLAESLNKKNTVPVVEGADGDLVQNGTAYIAPGGFHMSLLKDDDFGLCLGMTQDPPVNSCRPSVDVLFNSVIPIFKPSEIVAIIMTGMGRDGADGAEAISKAGGYIVSQSAETCTIYGMPKSVEDLGISDEVLDLEQIAPFMIRMGRQLPLSARK